MKPMLPSTRTYSFIVFVIELFLHHFACKHLLADLYLHLGVQLSILSIYQSHTHTLVSRQRVIARSYLTNRCSLLIQNSISMTGNGLIEEFYAHQFLGRALRLLLQQCFATNELRFVELDEERNVSRHPSPQGCTPAAISLSQHSRI